MKIETITKPAFTVIGREGSTEEGVGFVQRLWAEAKANFDQVAHLAKRDGKGVPVGFWGAMTDFSRSFGPWEEGFARGLYLAGVECDDAAEAPAGWIKWQVPGFEYLRAECDRETVFVDTLAHMEEQGLSLAGAVQDFTDPNTGKNYMLFPVKRL